MRAHIKLDTDRQIKWGLTLSAPIPLRLYTLPYLSNPPFLISDIRALSARAPECQKLKMVGLDQYGAEPFERQKFGVEGVNHAVV